MLKRYRSLSATLLGAALFFVLSEVGTFAAYYQFENTNPPWFSRVDPLWGVLHLLMPGLVVGFLVRANAASLGAISYALGTMAIYGYSYGYSYGAGDGVPRPFLFKLELWPVYLRDFVIFATLGAGVGLVGAWCRRRLTIGWSNASQLRRGREGSKD